MRLKVRPFLLLLLPLLLILLSHELGTNADTRYKQQVIFILDDDPEIEKAANFLYQKHDTTSFVVKWNTITHKLERVVWNGVAKRYETSRNQQPLPINGAEWQNTRVQAIGHGDIHSSNSANKIGGFTADALANTLITELSRGNVKRISIVGCTRRAELELQPTYTQEPEYLHSFMTELQNLGMVNTEVSIRSALVSVDQNGQKLTGELVLEPQYVDNVWKGYNEVGVQWSHKNPSNKWIGRFTTSSDIFYEQQLTALQPNDMPSSFFGILPDNTDVYVTHYPNGRAQPSLTYHMSDSDAFTWVDQVAQNVYTAGTPNERAPKIRRSVYFLDGRQPGGQSGTVDVIELRGIHDLLKELRHYGRTGGKRNQPKVYYRFGDWVVSMDRWTFYLSVEGIIVDSRDSNAKQAKIVEIQRFWDRLPNRKLHHKYPDMHLRTGDDFSDNVMSWLNGQNNQIGLEIENAYNAQCGMALFLSESIRSFQNHVTNMICLDLIRHGYLTKEYFFSIHPMGRGLTWQTRTQGALDTGLDMLRHMNPQAAMRNNDGRLNERLIVFNSIISRMSRIGKTWLSHIFTQTYIGSRYLQPGRTTSQLPTMALSSLEAIAAVIPHRRRYLREYELKQATGRLLSTTITEPETESISTQVEEFSTVEDRSLPARASLAWANDHVYVSDSIAKQVQLKEQQTGAEYEVIPDSEVVGDSDNSVSFQVQQKSSPTSHPEEITMIIDKSKLKSKALVEELEVKANAITKPSGTRRALQRINQGLAIYGVVVSFIGTINAFENGRVTEGVFNLSQTLHGIGELSGINKAIYRTSGKILGSILRSSTVKSLGATVSTIAGEKFASLLSSVGVSTVAGEEIGSLLRSFGGKLLSTAGRIGKLLEDVPIVGTAFGVYSIYEDFRQHSTRGNIDAALDISIVVLSAATIAAPETLPLVVLGLVILRLGNDLVLEAIEKSRKIDEQYDKDREFLRQLSDYHNYYTFVNEGDGARLIDFTQGSESWNGGNIIFYLRESGQSLLSLEDVDSNGHVRHEILMVDTTGVQDIVMGIGETQSFHFRTETAYVAWVIPVDSKTLISGRTGLRGTLHGTYYGNSHNNKFFAVQRLPPHNGLGYNLHDYHYQLYGMGGDDIFYLGPQLSYVEGNDGSDTYIVSSTSVYTEINNYATDGKDDYLIIKYDFVASNICGKRLEQNLLLYSESIDIYFLSILADVPIPVVVIQINNWFLGNEYQHMIFKTEDGVLFNISPNEGSAVSVNVIPYALTGATATSPVVLNALDFRFSQVMTLIGSPYHDELYGNAMDNHLNGGAGNDFLYGGEGNDTYSIDLDGGHDTLTTLPLTERPIFSYLQCRLMTL